MVKCSAWNCKSGYDSHITPPDVTFHRFPLARPALCAKWVQKMYRQDFQPSKNSRLCSLHFEKSDFQEVSSDTNKSRKQKKEATRGSAGLLRNKLKCDAVPRIFNFTGHKYLGQKKTPPKRKTEGRTSCAARRSLDLERLEEAELQYFDAQKLKDLDDLEKRLSEANNIPSGYLVERVDDSLIVYCTRIFPEGDVPTLLLVSSIVIDSSLMFKLSFQGKFLPADELIKSGVVKGFHFENFDDVTNSMAELKKWGDVGLPQQGKNWKLNYMLDCLEDVAQTDFTGPDSGKICFMVEQLRLMQLPVKGRWFSKDLLAWSCLINTYSPSVYDRLRKEDILCLPGKTTLKKLTKNITVDFDKNKADTPDPYLTRRFQNLHPYEKHVLLIMDEIYVSSRVEYDGATGKITGFTEEGEAVKTVLVYMVKSIMGKFQDIVALYPVSKLTSVLLNSATSQVLRQLKSAQINVVVLIADNHIVNRKYFQLLSGGGKIKARVVNPETGADLFLLSDPIHAFKNIYNNFQRRKTITLPTLTGDSWISADFSDVETMVKMEANQPLKMAHRVLKKALAPTNIERTSVKLAAGVLDETTAQALRWYSRKVSQNWNYTTEFIEMVNKFFKVVNVRTPWLNVKLRDEYRGQISSLHDPQIQLLQNFSNCLQQAHHNKTSCLSNETFHAVVQVCESLQDITEYCLNTLGMAFVLLGNFTSDPLESRFGRYRQPCGGNYYLSVRQLLQNEKKIRVQCLLKFSDCSVAELQALGAPDDQEVEFSKELAMKVASELADLLPDQDLEVEDSD